MTGSLLQKIERRRLPGRQVGVDRAARSPQYCLFTEFRGGNASKMSNTIELWDSIPKFCVTERQQAQLRDDRGRLGPYFREFTYEPSKRAAGERYSSRLAGEMTMKPASVPIDANDSSKGERDHYPAISEELVAEVLIKIFCDQRYGWHDAGSKESWVFFTLRQIWRELRVHNKTRSISEIKHALDVLSMAHYQIVLNNADGSGDDEFKHGGAFLSELEQRTRKNYLADPEGLWAARLPIFVTRSVNQMTYRQFNAERHLNLPTPLSRWLHKRLCHRWKQASWQEAAGRYRILLSTLIKESGYLNNAKQRANIASVKRALDEFCRRTILISYDCEDIVSDGRRSDVKFTLIPHPRFVDDVIDANVRARDGLQRARTLRVSG